MDLVDEILDDHKGGGKMDWHDHLIEHTMWFLSRTLLIAVIVGVSFLLGAPFRRLIGGEAVHEMEQMEKERQLEEFRLVQELSVSAAKFQPEFADSAKAVVEYQRAPSTESKNVAETKLHHATVALDRVRASFGNRKVQLHDDFETSINILIDDGEAGLRRQTGVLQDAARAPSKRFVTFDCNKTIIQKDVQTVGNYEQAYVLAKRQGL
jgi:hypothetical protein